MALQGQHKIVKGAVLFALADTAAAHDRGGLRLEWVLLSENAACV